MADKSGVKFLDLDEIVQDEVVIKLKGQEHKMVPLSVLSFVQNMKAIKALAGNEDPEQEVEIVHQMLGRSFPTLPMEEIRALSMEQITKLRAFADAATMAAQKKGEEEAGEANPPQAAPSEASTSDISSAA